MSKPKCDKCGPTPCKCHPCYDVAVGDCNKNTCCDKETTAAPVDPCNVPVICTEGCEEFMHADCIMTNCGLTLQQVIDLLIDPNTCLPYTVPPTCPDTIVSDCNTLGDINLNTISGAMGVNWTVSTAPVTSELSIGDVIVPGINVPDVLDNAGAYVFETTIDGCKTILNLDLFTVDVAITDNEFQPTCTYTSTIENVSFDLPVPNEPGYITSGDFIVLNSCLNNNTGGVHETVNLSSITVPLVQLGIGPDVFGSIATGGFVNTIKVARDDGNQNVTYHTIDLSPTGAVLSGCGGLTTPAALTYTSPNIAAFEEALNIALLNGICQATGDLPASIHVAADVSTIFSGGAAGRAVPEFTSIATHNPTGPYVGIDSTDAYLDWQVTAFPNPPGFPRETTLTERTLLAQSHSIPDDTSIIDTPCGELCYLAFISGSPGTFTFNNISFETEANTSVINICTGDGQVVNERVCRNRVVTVTLETGCNCGDGVETFLWSTGETTSSINVTAEPGISQSYTVAVTCDGRVTNKNVTVDF